jgi:hypothetical protein
VLVDAHVHLHPCFDTEMLLAKAAHNFRAAAPAMGMEPQITGVLLLAEAAGLDRFQELKRKAGSRARTGWEVQPTADDEALILSRGEDRLVVVAGFQITTAERLEILALATRSRVPDGLPWLETIRRVSETGAITVLAWGFGKWWFHRGTLVRDAMESGELTDIFLGDNGGRPRLGRQPALFAVAARTGGRVLAGSDPLPFGTEIDRVGSYGSIVEGELNMHAPAESLKRLLVEVGVRPTTFGRLRGFGPFLGSQARLRLLRTFSA